MLGRFPFLIREYQQRGSQFGGLGVLRPSGGANAVAGCWPTPEEHIPSGSDRVRVGLIATPNGSWNLNRPVTCRWVRASARYC
jgi:hypothetical protein